MSLLCRFTSACASRPAMLLTGAATVAIMVIDGTAQGSLDAFLSGGALLFGQAIYREAEPRDRALHRKLDSIIHGTGADDTLAGSEEA